MGGNAESCEDLLHRVANGDRAAFRALYGLTSARLYGICLALLRDRAQAEEVLQEGFTRIWERAKSFDRDKGAAMAWMTVLVRRLALDELRRPGRSNPSFDDAAAGLPDLAADMPDQDPIGRFRLIGCLNRLEPDRRRFVILAYLHGYTHEELARQFGRPAGTMKSTLFRALSDLRKCLA